METSKPAGSNASLIDIRYRHCESPERIKIDSSQDASGISIVIVLVLPTRRRPLVRSPYHRMIRFPDENLCYWRVLRVVRSTASAIGGLLVSHPASQNPRSVSILAIYLDTISTILRHSSRGTGGRELRKRHLDRVTSVSDSEYIRLVHVISMED